MQDDGGEVSRGAAGHVETAAVAPVPTTKQNGYPAKTNHRSGADLPPTGPPPPLYNVCVSLRDKIDAFLAEEFPPTRPRLQAVQRQLRVSMGVVEEALARYPMKELSLSYNGGKDCLVLLIVILACLARHFPPPPSSGTAPPAASNQAATTNGNTPKPAPQPNAAARAETDAAPAVQQPAAAHHLSNPNSLFPTSLQAVCIVSPHPFASLDAFVASSASTYHLDLSRYTMPMRQGLEAYLRDRPCVRAVFVGTRRTDPHGERLSHFDPTDHGWPQFVRVHPVIDWHYAEIWAFIRHLGIPYCPLYDQGYTSLGGTRDTHPNPHLKKEGSGKGEQEESFRPAYELMDDDEERLGRYV